MSIDSVEIFAENEQWTVRVTEGDEVATRSFDFLEFATSWATGQSLRIGVKVSHRPETLAVAGT